MFATTLLVSIAVGFCKALVSAKKSKSRPKNVGVDYCSISIARRTRGWCLMLIFGY